MSLEAKSFAEVKKRWLAEIGDKSWAELHDELEAESDAKVKSLMTPEYISNWGKLEKDLEEADEELEKEGKTQDSKK